MGIRPRVQSSVPVVCIGEGHAVGVADGLGQAVAVGDPRRAVKAFDETWDVDKRAQIIVLILQRSSGARV